MMTLGSAEGDIVLGIMPAVEPVMTIEAPRPTGMRCGTETVTAFITPSRSTSTASWKSSGFGSPMAMGRMPALAHRVVSWPSWPTPSSSAALSCSRSRTSALTVTQRRPWPSTSALVSWRSSQLDIGYGFDSMSAQMSMAMMSAPSDACLTACALPCPRPAPVMNETFPSMRPAMLLPS